jgi:hypothetical protein
MSKPFNIKDELYKYLDKHCKCNCEIGEQPWGCFDCQNTGVIPNSEEAVLIYYAARRICDLEDKLKIAVDGLEEIRVNYPNSTFNTFYYTKHILDQLKETK